MLTHQHQHNYNNVLDYVQYTVQYVMGDCNWQFYRGCKQYGGGYWKEQLRETETRKYEIYSCCRCKIGHLTHFKPPRLPHESSRRPSDNRSIGAVGAIGHAGRSN